MVAVDCDLDGVTATVEAIRKAGGSAIALQADVASEADMNAAVEAALSEYGELGIAVAAAGIVTMGSTLELHRSEWQRVIDVNLTGTFLTAKACLPAMLERGNGAFVAVASDAATRGANGFAAYAASKHGVLGLVRSLALEFGGRGVRSNAVCPSFTETPMTEAIFRELQIDGEAYAETRVMGRLARPEEVAAVIAHLVGDGAAYTNGAAYAVDGGLTAG